MSILLTGAAGFIGYHVAEALLQRGESVLGIDNLNDYYDPSLKHARLERLRGHAGFFFQKIDIADREAMEALRVAQPQLRQVIHLAAQPGVRYSLEHPHVYAESNLVGHLNVLEFCRHMEHCEHLVYASSSSVYGGNHKLPFSESDPVEQPVSLYAATKRADELMSHTYAHLYGVPSTGLRFFTVYGPWGRPDMAAFKFVKAIFEGRPIDVYNHGEMRRDFTYVDDIVAGVLAALNTPPDEVPLHRVFNLGNHQSEELTEFIRVIESTVGVKAVLNMKPMQPGDVKETYADIALARKYLGFEPRTSIAEGIPRFVEWYREFYSVQKEKVS